MFNKIKKIIDEWDPIELLMIHCPSDEYDEISFELTQKIADDSSVEFIANAIFELFVQAYSVPTFNKTIDECKRIAQKIVESIKFIK